VLLGEWACLGALAEQPAHGFAVAKRLAPEGDLGRIWALSRPLTYRAIDQLVAADLVAPVRTEPGRAGGSRTVLAPTAAGRRRLVAWLQEPVQHVRDLRTELLLKLELATRLGVDPAPLLGGQRAVVDRVVAGIAAQLAESTERDPVLQWRYESALAAARFLDWAARQRE
jgi:DNA-binding PadR family transcriptional regulator